MLIGRAVQEDARTALTHVGDQLALGRERARPETPTRLGNGVPDGPMLVRSVDYANYLHRAASASDLMYWEGQFQQGASDQQVIANFLGSQEYLGSP
jgi:hypothetical protein